MLELPEPMGERRMQTRSAENKQREEVSHLVSGCLILFLRVHIRVWLHMEVPSIELHNIPIFHVRQDLGQRLICVTLVKSRTWLSFLPAYDRGTPETVSLGKISQSKRCGKYGFCLNAQQSRTSVKSLLGRRRLSQSLG